MIIKFNLIIFLWLAVFLQVSADNSQPLKIVGGEMSSLKKQMEPGKWTVVMIWANSCHICEIEAGKYSNFHTEHATKDAKIIGISIDGSESLAQKFVTRHQLNYPNLVGSQREVASLYLSESRMNFRGTPSFMVYDPTGVLVNVQAGAVDPEIVESFIAANSL